LEVSTLRQAPNAATITWAKELERRGDGRVGVEEVTLARMEEWKGQYPEAFERGYDPTYGMHFNAWVEGSA
jgi:hypothetical protein